MGLGGRRMYVPPDQMRRDALDRFMVAAKGNQLDPDGERHGVREKTIVRRRGGLPGKFEGRFATGLSSEAGDEVFLWVWFVNGGPTDLKLEVCLASEKEFQSQPTFPRKQNVDVKDSPLELDPAGEFKPTQLLELSFKMDEAASLLMKFRGFDIQVETAEHAEEADGGEEKTKEEISSLTASLLKPNYQYYVSVVQSNFTKSANKV